MNRFIRAFQWTPALLMLAFFTIACQDKRPEGVLSPARMVDILEEIYVSEAQLNQLALSRDSSRLVANVVNTAIFDSAGVTDSTFRYSFDYYMSRPEELEAIYTALVDSLQLREQRARQP